MSRLDRAIIFAAGMGTRLGPQTRDLPKTLLTVGKLSIFDRMIMGLDRIGIKDVVVVIGYAGAGLRSHALLQTSKLVNDRLSFEFITNDSLDIGNIYSFWLAKKKMIEKDALLLNSDVVFDYRILDLLKADQNPSSLAIDKSMTLGAEEMKVKLGKGQIIKEMSKELDPSVADGEFIGIMKVSNDVAGKVIDKVEKLLTLQKFPLYYEDAFRLVAHEEDCLAACSTSGLPWTEIDTVDDMNYAQSIIVPQLELNVI